MGGKLLDQERQEQIRKEELNGRVSVVAGSRGFRIISPSLKTSEIPCANPTLTSSTSFSKPSGFLQGDSCRGITTG
jgi:hypothetical protein